jgi:PEP-CTERM motif-containing protein
MTLSKLRVFLTCGLLLVAVSGANADTITLADTFAADDLYSVFGAHALTETQEIAYPFVPPRTVTLKSIAAALSHHPDLPVPTVIMSVRASAGGLPGAMLEQFVFHPVTLDSQLAPVEVALSTMHPRLLSGHEYWLSGRTTGDQGLWNHTVLDRVDAQALLLPTGEWILQQDRPSAFRVTGEFADAPVPEPGTFVLIGAGAILFATFGRRRRAAGVSFLDS